MKAEIEIINVLKYDSEKAGKGTRLNFRMLGTSYLSKMKNLKGYTNLDCYYTGHEVFNKVPETFCGAKVEAEFVPDPQNTDPLKPRQIISSLSCNGSTISLL